MTKEELQKALDKHERWLHDKPDGERLDLSWKDLRNVDLRGANLCEAILRGVGLQHANLSEASLYRANLQGADLTGANLNRASLPCADAKGATLCEASLRGAYLKDVILRDANLCAADFYGANLRGADLLGANLSGASLHKADLYAADLRCANLDFAAYPLWCGSLNMKIDKRIAAQLLYHALRAMQSCADEPDVAAVLASGPCLKLANQFRRVTECGWIEPPKEGEAE